MINFYFLVIEKLDGERYPLTTWMSTSKKDIQELYDRCNKSQFKSIKIKKSSLPLDKIINLLIDNNYKAKDYISKMIEK